jgi:hypothetical protein
VESQSISISRNPGRYFQPRFTEDRKKYVAAVKEGLQEGEEKREFLG